MSFGKEKGGEREKEKCRSGREIRMQKEEERAVLSGRVRLIEGLTIGRMRKLDVGEGILFNRMRTSAGNSCPSTCPHINLLCVLVLGACTYNVHLSLVLKGELLHILFTCMRILWFLHHLSLLKVKNRWQSLFSWSIFQPFCCVITTNILPELTLL